MSIKQLANIDLGGLKVTGAADGTSSTDYVTLQQLAATQAITTLGDLGYGGSGGAVTRLAGNTSTTPKFLRQVGDGTNSAAPTWGTLLPADIASAMPWIFIQPSTDMSGTTDTLAINNALAAGNWVQLGKGTYYVSNLLLESYSGLIGVSTSTIVKGVSGTTGYVVALKTPASSQRTMLRDFSIDANQTSLGAVNLDNTGFGTAIDPLHTIDNVVVISCGADAFHFDNSMRELRVARTYVHYSVGFAYYIGAGCTDSRFEAMTSGPSNLHGFEIIGNNNLFVNIKAFYAGYNGSTWDDTQSGIHLNGCAYVTIVSSGGQQNGLHGIFLDGATYCSVTGNETDTNNSGGGTTGCGIYVNASTYCTVMGNVGGNNGILSPGAQVYGVAVNGVNTGTWIGMNTVQGTAASFGYISGYGYLLVDGSAVDLSGAAYVKLSPPVYAAATVQALTSSGTITTTGNAGLIPVTETANVNSMILGVPTNPNSQLTIVNRSGFSITFAASGTSHVAGGTGEVIPPYSSRLFIYDTTTTLWYGELGSPVYAGANGLAQVTNPSGLVSFLQQSQAAAVTSITATAATIKSLGAISIPANDPIAGARYKFTGVAQVGTAATAPTATLDVRWGGTSGTLLLSLVTGTTSPGLSINLVNAPCLIEAELNFITSTTVEGWLRMTLLNSTTTSNAAATSLATITTAVSVTTTSAESLTVNWTWSAAASGTTIKMGTSSFERVS